MDKCKVQDFKNTLIGLTTLELRNVGCFTLSHTFNGKTEDIILVVQTYTEDEVNVVLERAVEQELKLRFVCFNLKSQQFSYKKVDGGTQPDKKGL